jgi:hypothetical protein
MKYKQHILKTTRENTRHTRSRYINNIVKDYGEICNPISLCPHHGNFRMTPEFYGAQEERHAISLAISSLSEYK